MIELAFIVSSLTFLTFLFSAILATVFHKEIAINNRVENYFGKTNIKEKKENKTQDSLLQSLFRHYWLKGTNIVEKKLEKKAQLKLAILLRDAGYSNLSAIEFRLIQLVACIGLGFLSFLLMASIIGGQAWFMALGISFLGFRYPMFHLAKKKTKRVKEINREMADFFDMVNLLLEAGVGLDAALYQVCNRKTGPLSDEFKLALDEMKRGKSRREALYNLKKRVSSEGFQSVLSSIIQADQLGIGMSKVIRNLTIRIREQQRETAREQAMKAPVKMLFPMIFFIFPTLFIVILGPLAVRLITQGLGGG